MSPSVPPVFFLFSPLFLSLNMGLPCPSIDITRPARIPCRCPRRTRVDTGVPPYVKSLGNIGGRLDGLGGRLGDLEGFFFFQVLEGYG